MAAVNTHVAIATREGKRWWIVEVDGVGTTQARNLVEAREMARSLVAVTLDIPEDGIDVRVTVALDPHLQAEVEQARTAITELERKQHEVAAASRKAARDLVKGAGLTGRDAAVVLGISPQRVSQLLAG